NRLAIAEAEDLHLDMAGVTDVALQKDGPIVERAGGERLGRAGTLLKILRPLDDAHSDSAAASAGLDQQRIAHRIARLPEAVDIALAEARAARHDRNTRGLGKATSTFLVAHRRNGLGAWANEDQVRILHGPGKVRVLGQKSIAWVNGVRARS